MTDYICTSCDLAFETDAKARCPSCMRMTTVLERDKRTSGSAGRRSPVWMILGLVAVLVAGAAAWWWTANRTSESPETSEVVQFPTTESLDAETQRRHQLVMTDDEVATAAQTIIGNLEGRNAASAVSAWLQLQLTSRELIILREDRIRRRKPLKAETLADGTLTSIAKQEGAHLYAVELTMLVSALLQEANVSHDLVLLDPMEPTIGQFPAAAVRLDDDLVLDPHTAMLRHAPGLRGYGAEILWAQHALVGARRALASGDLELATTLADAANRLVPALWIARAIRAEVAIQRGELEVAAEMSRDLAVAGDHPYAWLVENMVEVAQASPESRADVRLQGLRDVTEAFPFEAGLAVELGDLLLESGEAEEAQDVYALALMRNADVGGARIGLARLLGATDPERSMELLRDELALHPANSRAYLTMAWLHAMYGADADAERALERGREVAINVDQWEVERASLMGRLEKRPQ